MISLPENIKELLVRGKEVYLQNVAIDNVIFGYHEKSLKVLLQRSTPMGIWMLPGGFIRRNETVETAAARVAEERTGLKDLFLQQFHVFSKPDRNKDGTLSAEILSRLSGLSIGEDHWLLDRFITIGFYTLTDFSKVTVSGGFYMEECRWCEITEVPVLMFDHNEMINKALQALRIHLAHFPISDKLLPEKFTLPELRTLYETILGRELDDRNFSKKFMNAGLIEKLTETRQTKGHRPPFLYRFNRQKYLKALQEGLQMQ